MLGSHLLDSAGDMDGRLHQVNVRPARTPGQEINGRFDIRPPGIEVADLRSEELEKAHLPLAGIGSDLRG